MQRRSVSLVQRGWTAACAPSSRILSAAPMQSACASHSLAARRLPIAAACGRPSSRTHAAAAAQCTVPSAAATRRAALSTCSGSGVSDPPRDALSEGELQQMCEWSDGAAAVTPAQMEQCLRWAKRATTNLDFMVLLRIIAQYDGWRALTSMQRESDGSLTRRAYYNFHPLGREGRNGVGFYSSGVIHPTIAASTTTAHFAPALETRACSGEHILRELLQKSERRAHPTLQHPPSYLAFAQPGFDAAYFNIGDEEQQMVIHEDETAPLLRAAVQTVHMRRQLREASTQQLEQVLLPRWFGRYAAPAPSSAAASPTAHSTSSSLSVCGIGVRPSEWVTLRHPQGGSNAVMQFRPVQPGGRPVLALFEGAETLLHVLRVLGMRVDESAIAESAVTIPSESVAPAVHAMQCDVCIVTRAKAVRPPTTAAAADNGKDMHPFDGVYITHQQMSQAGNETSDARWEEPQPAQPSHQ